MKRGRKKITHCTLFARFSAKDKKSLDEAVYILNQDPENFAIVSRSSFIRKAVMNEVEKILNKDK